MPTSPGGGVAALPVAVFGGRQGAPTQPYDFDIGRKLVLCFQACCTDNKPYILTRKKYIPYITLHKLIYVQTFSYALAVTYAPRHIG